MGFKGIGRKWVLIASITIIAVATFGFYSLVLWPSSGEITVIVWQRSGGFAGLKETLTIEPDGSMSLSSNLLGEKEFVLSEAELKDLLSLIEDTGFMGFDESYGSRSGVADFFSYSLIVKKNSGSKLVEWVDDWASEKKLPGGLKDVEEHMLSIIHGEGLGSIKGTASSGEGDPVAGLVVSIVNGSVGFPEIAVMTDDKGFYQIGSVPPGVFKVGVHDELGERIGLDSVYVIGGENSILNFTVHARETITQDEEPNKEGEAQEGVIVGRRAINFSLKGLDEQNFSLGQHRGEVVLIEFMTTWCGVCKRQHAELERLYAKVDDLTIVTVEIDVILEPEKFVEWALEQEYDWFIGHSPDLGLTYQVRGVPTILVVDKEGIIRFRGFFTNFGELQFIIQQYQ